MPRRPPLTSEAQAEETARRFRNLDNLVKETGRAARPLREALRAWLDAHPGAPGIVADGIPALVLVERRSGKNVDTKAMAVQDRDLIDRLADLGLLRVDWEGVLVAIKAGLLAWPVAPGGGFLYVWDAWRTEMRWAGEEG